MASSGEAFDLLYRGNDRALGRLVWCDRVEAWLANGKVVQDVLIQFTEHHKTVVTLGHLHANELASRGAPRIDMDQRDIVKTAEPLMDQINMIAIESAHDDHDTRTTGGLAHPPHCVDTPLGGSAHKRCLSGFNRRIDEDWAK